MAENWHTSSMIGGLLKICGIFFNFENLRNRGNAKLATGAILADFSRKSSIKSQKMTFKKSPHIFDGGPWGAPFWKILAKSVENPRRSSDFRYFFFSDFFKNWLKMAENSL